MHTFKPILRSSHNRLENLNLMTMMKVQKQCCFYCNKHMSLDSITKDHLFPKSHGFWLQGNLVLAHAKCNSDKGARYPTPAEIIRWHGLHKGNKRDRLRISTKNNKPHFKLVLTPELIFDHLH